ncbi:Ig-like domain-containing protein [Vibrio crassostreae]|uniref:Ig-like domain-containing protein n=1 Tax=Vibrio crassostreae TaxID=246167 RepID=UPI001B315DAE|nr:Ig-like domain-containing protein [Vibrio crassostreae]
MKIIKSSELYNNLDGVKSITGSSFDLIIETSEGKKILVEDGLTELVTSQKPINLADGTSVTYKTLVNQMIADKDSIEILDSNFIGDVYSSNPHTNEASTDTTDSPEQSKVANIIQKLKANQEDSEADVSESGREDDYDQDIEAVDSEESSKGKDAQEENEELIKKLEELEAKLAESAKAQAESDAKQAESASDAVEDMANELQAEDVEVNENTSKLTGEFDTAPTPPVSAGSSGSADPVEEEEEETFELTVSLDAASDSGKSGDSITNVSEPVFKGTGTPNSVVILTINGSSYTSIVDANGNYEFPPVPTLEEGSYTYTVTDSLGNTTSPKTIVIDQTNTLEAELQNDSGYDADDEITNVNEVVIIGKTDPGAEVVISIGGKEYTTIANAEGEYTLVVDDALEDGSYEYTVTSTDVAGNKVAHESVIVIDTKIDATVGLSSDQDSGVSNSDGLTNVNKNIVIGGQIETGYQEIEFIFNGQMYPVNPDEDGNWSVTIQYELPDGDYEYSLRVVDAAGNEDTIEGVVTIDTHTEATGGLSKESDTGEFDDDNLTNINKPTFNGTAEAGATVTVIIDGKEYTTTTDEDGYWEVQVGGSSGLDEDTYSYEIISEDRAGNVSEPVKGEITIDTGVDVTTWIANDSGSSSSDGITKNSDVQIKGQTEAGATAYIVINGGQKVALDVQPDGTFTYNTGELPDGNYTYEVVVEDKAGNVKSTGSQSFTVDTVTQVEGGLDKSSDTGFSSSDGYTKDSTPKFSGKGEPNSEITVIIDGQEYTTRTDDDGEWSVEVTNRLSDGVHEYEIVIEDTAGNKSTEKGSIEVDTKKPEAPTINLDNDTGKSSSDWITKDGQLELSGTSEAGSKLTLEINGVDYSDYLVIESDGTWTLELDQPLPEGEYTIVVESTDRAGNVQSNEQTVTIDTSVSLTADLDKDSDTGRDSNDNVTQDTTPVISGTGDKGSEIVVTIDGQQYHTTVDEFGRWELEVTNPLSDGEYNYTVEITDEAGNTTTANGTIVVDTVVPNAIEFKFDTDSGASRTDNLSNDPRPSFSGNVDDDCELTIVFTDEHGTEFKFYSPSDISIDENGDWSFVSPVDFAEGTYTVDIIAEDLAGNETKSTTTIELDFTISEFTAGLDSSSDTGESQSDNLTNDNTPTFTGRGEPDSKIRLTINGQSYETTVGADGTWSVDVKDPLPHNPESPYDYTVVIEDAAGNTDVISGSIVIDTTTHVDVNLSDEANSRFKDDTVTNVSKPTFEGKTEAGCTVTLTVDGKSYDVVADANGNWSFTMPTDLSDGTYKVDVIVVDAAGNTSSDTINVTIDTDTNITGGLDVGSDSAAIDNITNDNTPTFSGDCEPNSDVVLNINGKDYVATVTNDGKWSVDVPDTLVDGDYNYTVTITDKAGNTETISGQITVDTVTKINSIELDTSSDSAEKGDWITNDNTPVISGKAEPDATIYLYVDDEIYSTTVDADGNWSIDDIQTLPDGTHTFDVKIVDVAGNEKTYPSNTITIDTQAPQFDPMNLENDTGFSSNDKLTNEETLTLSGKTEDDTIAVEVQIGGNVYKSPDDITVNADGSWEFTTPDTYPENSNGYNYTITYTDKAGNISTETGKIVVDTSISLNVGLEAKDDSGVSGDDTTNVTKPTFSGKTDPDAKVVLTINGHEYTTYADKDGNYSVVVGHDLPDGEYDYTVVATDPAGNTITENGSVTIDTTPSSLSNIVLVNDTGSDSSDFITNDNRPHLKGTVEPESELKITITDGVDTYTYSSPADFTIDEDGSWSLKVDDSLSDGDYTFKFESTDKAGNTSSRTVDVVIDTQTSVTVELDANSDTGSSNSDNLTNETNPTIKGVGEPNSTVTISVNGYSYETVVGADGTWSYTIPDELNEGTNVITVTSTDIAGNTDTATLNIEVDTVTPTLRSINLDTDSGVADDDITNDNTPTFSGQVEAGASITFEIDGITYSSPNDITVDADGNWTFTVPDSLPDGTHSYKVTATDEAGNSKSSTGSVTIDTSISLVGRLDEKSDTGESSKDNLTKADTPTFSGTTDPFATVAVVINGVEYSGQADASGYWEVKVDDSLSDGDYNYSITAEDAAGNTQTLNGKITVDTQSPDGTIRLVNDSGESSSDNITYHNQPVLSGTSEPDSTVQIKYNGITYSEPTVVVNDDGTWSFIMPDELSDGEHTVELVVTDSAGNKTTTPLTFTIDTQISLTGGLDRASDTGDFDDDNITNENKPTFSGTGEVGATVTLTINGQKYETEVDADGNWEITVPDALADGDYSYTIKIEDTAGNQKTISDTITVDQTALVSGGLDSASDSGFSNSDNYTNDTTPTFSGTSEPFAEITITIDGQTKVVTADENGDWSTTIDTPLSDGTYTYEISTKDVAGNHKTVSDSLTIDTTPPATPTVSLDNDTGHSISDGITNSDKPAFSGKIDPENKVELTIDGKTYAQPDIYVDASGNWSFVVPVNLEDGDYNYEVVVTDKAGNQSTASGQVTVDTQFDFSYDLEDTSDTGVKDDWVTRNPNPTLSGTTEPDTKFIIKVDGNTYAVQADSNGDWSFTIPDPLPHGTHTIEIIGTDVAGNTLTKTVDIVIDTMTTVSGGLDASTDTGASNSDGITKSTNLKFSGEGEAGSTITLTINNTEYTTQVDEYGKWEITLGTSLPDGEYSYTIEIEDKAGNTETITDTVIVDTSTVVIADLDSASDTGSSDTDKITKETRPTFNGVAEEGSTVVIKIDGVSYNVTVEADGSWEFTQPFDLSDGNHSWEVISTDPAGNTDSKSGSFLIDTTTDITGGLDLSSNTGSKSDTITSDNTPTFSGTGEAGAEVTLTIDGVEYSTQVNPDGTWSIDVPVELSDGTYSYTLVVEDTAGNTKTISDKITVDTTVFVTGGLDINSDSGKYIDDITSDTTPTFSGTGEAGATVVLTINGRTYETEVDENGEWEIDVTHELNVDKSYPYTIDITDDAGNTDSISGSIVIDTSTTLTGGLDADSDSNIVGDEITNDNKPTFSGKAEKDAEVTITIDGTTYPVTVASDGSWTFEVPSNLPDGSYSYTINSEDKAGNTASKSGTVVIDTSTTLTGGLDRDSDTGDSKKDGLTNDNMPTFSGTGEVGATVTLTINGETYFAIVDPAGNWEIDVDDALPDGEHSYDLVIEDAAGNTQTISDSITVDTEIVLTGGLDKDSDSSIVGDDITNDNKPTFSGKGEPGATVTLTIDGVKYETEVDENGDWAINLSYSLSDGDYSYKLESSDAAGNEKVVAGQITVDTQTTLTGGLDQSSDSGSSNSDNYTSDNTPRFSGTGEVGAEVTLTIDGQSYTATVDNSGNWFIDVPNTLPDATHPYTIVIEDTAGNTETLNGNVTVDTSTSVSGGLSSSSDTGSSNNDDLTKENTPTFSGTGEVGAEVTVTINGESYKTTVGADGTWSVQVADPLPEGNHSYKIDIVDQAGNTDQESGSIEVDTSITLTGGLDSSSDSGKSDSDDLTSNTTPTFSGTGEVGAKVTLTIDGIAYETQVGADGTWSIDVDNALPEGDNPYSIVIEDDAGNTKTINGSVEIDTSITLDGGLDRDSDTNLKDNVTSDNTPTFSGTGEAGAEVTLTINGNDYSTVVQPDGTWSINVGDTLPDNTYNYDLVIVDDAGNTTSESGSITVDTTITLTGGLDSVSDTGTSDKDNLTNDNTPTFSGTGEVGAEVILTIDGQEYKTAVGADGTWSIELPTALSDDTYPYEIETTDLAGNTKTLTGSIEVDTTTTLTGGLDSASDTGSSSSDNLTKDNNPTFSGKAEPNAEITLTINGKEYYTSADASGNWSITVSDTLPDGDQPYTIKSVDTAGNEDTVSGSIEIDTTIDVTGGLDARSDSEARDNLTSDTSPWFSGTGESGSTIEVTVDGNTYTTVVNPDGTWELQATNPITTDGTYTVTIKITDEAGNTKTVSDSIEIDTETSVTSRLDSASDTGVIGDDTTSDNKPTFSGTGEAGSTITLTINGYSYNTVVAADGTYSIQVEDVLPDGDYDYTITSKDAAGNTDTSTGSISVDTTVDIAGGLDRASDTEESDNITSDNKPKFSGTGEAGATVKLTINGIDYTTEVNPDGTWSVDVTNTLPDGNHNYTLEITDDAGNTNSIGGTVVVDTQISLTGEMSDWTDTGFDNKDNITSNNQPSFNGTGEAGASITVKINGESYTTVVQPDGTWQLTLPDALPDNDYSYEIITKDTAGNTKTVTGNLTIDTSTEAVGGLDRASDSSSADNITNVNKPEFSGTGEEGALVQLTINGMTYDTYVDASGNWSITIPDADALADGDYNYTITVTDVAGNTDTISDTITIDTSTWVNISLAGSSDSGSSSNDGVTSDTTPTFTGKAEVGATVHVVINGKTYDENNGLVVDANGNWSLTVPPEDSLPDGTHTAEVYVTDTAGNTNWSQTTIIVDTQAPNALNAGLVNDSEAADLITNNNTPVFSGSSEAGTTITVRMNGVTQSANTVTVNPDGTWTFTAPNSLSDGDYTFEFISTDAAGNSESVTKTITVDTTTSVTGDLSSGSDTGESSSDKITNDTTPTFTGTGEVGSEVTLTIDGKEYKTQVGADGTWSITVTDPLDGTGGFGDGTDYSYTITSKDTAGNTDSRTGTITVDTTPPDKPQITLVSDSGVQGDNITKDNTPLISGVVDDGTTVVVTVSGIEYTVTPNARGEFSFTVTDPLPDGDHVIEVVTTDKAGNKSSETLTIHVDTTNITSGGLDAGSDTGSSNSDNLTSDVRPDFSGKTDPNSSVTLIISAPGKTTVTLNTVADANGNYSFSGSDLPFDLSDGEWTYEITSTDNAGNETVVTDTIVIDTYVSVTAKLDPAYDSATDGDGLTNNKRPRMSGTVSDPDDEVKVQIYDENGALVETINATVNADGTWYADPTTDLPDGHYDMKVIVSDDAGNKQTKWVDVEVDTQDPTNFNAWLANASDTGTKGDGITQDNTPTFKGTVEVGCSVRIEGLGDSTIYARVEADGSWEAETPTALADGTYNYRVIATDPAGNEVSYNQTITIDNTISLSADISKGDDTGWSDSDNVTKKGKPDIEVYTDPLSTVTITVSSTTPPKTLTYTADENGHLVIPFGDLWGVGGKAPDGTYNYSIEATDPAGNTKTINDSITIDTMAPTNLSLDLDSNSDSASKGDWITNDNQPVLKGTVEPDVALQVQVGSSVYDVTVNADGTWSFAVPELTDGTYAITVTATDKAGNTSQKNGSITIDTVPPQGVTGRLDASSDEGMSDSDSLTNKDSNLTFSGTTEPGTTIQIKIGGDTYNATVRSDGTWTCTPVKSYPDGTYTVEIIATDKAGNVNDTEKFYFEVDTTPPTLTGVQLDPDDDTGKYNNDGITNVKTPTLVGDVSTDAVRVWVTIDGGDGTEYEATINPDGTWSVKIEPALSDGSYSYTVYAEDQAGNKVVKSGYNFTVDTTNTLRDVELTDDTDSGVKGDWVTNDTTPTFSGETDVGNNINLVIKDNGGNIVYQVNVTAMSPEFEITVPHGVLVDGSYSFTITSTDDAGNSIPVTGSFKIDTVSELDGGLSSVSDTGVIGDGKTNHKNPTFSGTSEEGSVVTIKLTGKIDGVYKTETYTLTVGSSGTWSYAIPDDLETGNYTYEITAQDPAGNISDTESGGFTVDLSPPTVDGDITTDTGSSSSDNITKGVNGYLDFNGTSDDAIKITVKVGGKTFETTPNPDGTWSIVCDQLIADGTYTYEIIAEDDAGNKTTTTGTVTLDTTIELVASLKTETDSGVKNDNITNSGKPSIDIVTEPNMSVSATLKGQSIADVPLGSFTADANGVLVVDLSNYLAESLLDGYYTIEFVATDEAGNTDTVSYTFEIDQTAPSVTVDAYNGGEITDGIPEIKGTAEAGATIRVTINGEVYTTTADSSGNWQIPPSSLPGFADGEYEVSVVAYDAAGNSTEVEDTFIINTGTYGDGWLDAGSDTGKLDSDGVTQDRRPTFQGTAERGSTVTVIIRDEDGNIVSQESVVADVNGLWNLTLSSDLDDGFYTYEIKVDDGTGNVITTEPSDLVIDNDISMIKFGVEGGGYQRFESDENTYYSSYGSPYVYGQLGNNDANADIVVTIDGKKYYGTTDANGNFTITLTPALPDGRYDVEVDVTDAAGNTMPTREFQLDIDTTIEGSWDLENDTSGRADDGNTYGLIVNEPPKFSGTCDDDSALYVRVRLFGDENFELRADEAEVADGTWEVDFAELDIPDGTYTYDILIYEKSGGHRWFEGSLTVDTTNELLLIDDIDKNVDDDGNWTSTTFTGYAEAGTEIQFIIDGKTYTTTTGSNGIWTVEVPVTADGSYDIEIISTDKATNEKRWTDDNPSTIDIDFIDELAVDIPEGGAFNPKDTPLTGTGDVGLSLKIVLTDESGKKTTKYASVDSDGTWYVDLSNLDDGTYTYEIIGTGEWEQKTINGSFVIDTVAPEIESIELNNDTGTDGDNITNEVRPEFSGKVEAGTHEVQIVIDGVTYSSKSDFTLNADGTFTFITPVDLDDGTYNVKVYAIDEIGNTSTQTVSIVIDSTPPTIDNFGLVDDSGVAGDGITNNNRTPLTGKVSSDVVALTITVDGVDYHSGTDFTLSPDGSWTLDTGLTYADGVHNVTISATDGAGNTTTTDQTFEIITGAPTGSGELDDSSDTGVKGDYTTNDPSPSFSGTGQAGNTVTVTIDGIEYTTQVDANGDWLLEVPDEFSDGNHFYVITIEDKAGNSTQVGYGMVTIDTVSPVVDGGLDDVDGIVDSANPTFSGTGEAGAYVTVVIDGVEYETRVNFDGTWSLECPDDLSEGNHTYEVYAEDAAGNRTDIESGSFTIDTVAPTGTAVLDESTDTGVVGDNITENTTPTFSGEGEVGGEVSLTINGKTYSATVDVNGEWAVSVPVEDSLTEGSYEFSIEITDTAGNTTEIANDTLVIEASGVDTESVAVAKVVDSTSGDIVTHDETPEFNGVAEEGDVIELAIEGEVYSTEVNGDGSWSIETSNNLIDGDYPYSITKVTDGEASTIGEGVVTVDTTLAPIEMEMAPVVDGDEQYTNSDTSIPMELDNSDDEGTV